MTSVNQCVLGIIQDKTIVMAYIYLLKSEGQFIENIYQCICRTLSADSCLTSQILLFAW